MLGATTHALAPGGATLASAVYGFHTLLHDPNYRYSVEHRPAAAWPWTMNKCAQLDFGRDHADTWLRALQHDQVDVVLVYQGRCEAEVLDRPDSGCILVYEQPEGACRPIIYAAVGASP